MMKMQHGGATNLSSDGYLFGEASFNALTPEGLYLLE